MLPGSLPITFSDPSPSPSHHDGAHTVLVAAGEKLLVGDDLGPEYSQDSSKVLGVEGGQFVEVAFSRYLALLSRTVGWKVRSPGAVLAWLGCCIGMTSIRCLAF